VPFFFSRPFLGKSIYRRKWVTDYEEKMNVGKSMDFDAVTRTFLAKNPGCKAAKLVVYLAKKTKKSRSTIFENLEHMASQEKLYREKGCYWLKKPEEAVPKGFVSQISDAIESRSKRKRLERDEKCRRMQ
jgi:hypothetical protein